MRAQIDRNRAFPLDDPKVVGSCDTLVTLLIRFLGCLPKGLVTGTCTALIIAEAKRRDADADASDFRSQLTTRSYFAILRAGMSRNKCEMLAAFVRHWRRVAEHEDANRMNGRAVATCVFPAVFPALDLILIDILESMLRAPAEVR